MEFDGRLKNEELLMLRDALVSEKQIRKIENFLAEYKNSLTSFIDIVGDDLIPTKQFYFNIKYISKLLDNDPEKVLSKFGVTIRGLTTARLVRLLAHNFMTSKQVFENRNELLNSSNTSDKDINLPKNPVIWAPNHHFKDDALATVRAAKRPVTMMFGSIPLYFNTFDGVLAYLIGSILINRKSENSKEASMSKANRALELGSDLLWCPEGVHNKTPNLLMLELWKGIYRVANDKGVKVVPITHYIFDPTQKLIPHELNPIHTVVDDPIDMTKFSEEAGLKYLRDVIATWYYLMMEKYGKITREELFKYYQKRKENYGGFKQQPLSIYEVGVLYNKDLRSTVNGYDKTIEATADCRPKNIVRPEDAFKDIVMIRDPHLKDVNSELSMLVKERKKEDFQRLY